MGNNEMMAMANAREIEKLPYETLKALFPSVRYMVQGEKWHRKFIGHRTNEITGREETYAAGEWRADRKNRVSILWHPSHPMQNSERMSISVHLPALDAMDAKGSIPCFFGWLIS